MIIVLDGYQGQPILGYFVIGFPFIDLFMFNIIHPECERVSSAVAHVSPSGYIFMVFIWTWVSGIVEHLCKGF